MRKEQLWGFILAIVLTGAVAGGTVLLKQQKTFSFSDEKAGIEVSLSASYTRELREDKEESRFNKLIAHFVKADPPTLITLRYETGIRKAASLLRRTPIEHFTYEIQQYFPVKYSGYEPELLGELEIAGKESLEHIFGYQDVDGTAMKTRLFIVPWDENTAYYLILQAKEQDFRKVAGDLDVLKKSLELPGPQTESSKEDTP